MPSRILLYVICFFFHLVNFRQLIFTQPKLNKDNFTSRVWWALIEVIVPCAEEMAGEKEMSSCVRGYHIYENMWAAAIGESLVCHCWKIFFCKILFARKIFSFTVHENIFTTKKKAKTSTKTQILPTYFRIYEQDTPALSSEH